MDIIVENIKKLFIGDDKNENINTKKEEKVKKDINKVINLCSRCGGQHFDLSCIYSKN